MPIASCCWPSRSISPAWAGRSATCSSEASPAEAGLAARVGVEPAPGLLAQVSLVDEPDEDIRRRKVGLSEVLVQDPHDPKADVEPDEVGQLERSHRMVEPDPRPRVDVAGRTDPLLVGPHGLAEEGHEDPVDDEAGSIRRDD